MQPRISHFLPVLSAALGVASVACESDGVGDPCIPEDEYRTNFAGYSETEVNIESRSYQCETRVCLAAYFRGRVSCPYGNPDGNANRPDPPNTQCYLPGSSSVADQIEVPVAAQLADRRPEDAVYCSCRCNGPDPNANYCECPSGYVCQELIDDIGLGNRQLTGSYCVKDGTQVPDPGALENDPRCTGNNCGPPNPFVAQ
jgi:hypothetical protein